MNFWEFLYNLEVDVRFWTTVTIASALKWLFTPESNIQTRKQAIAGIIAGAACAFYGADYIMSQFTITMANRDIVLIGLVFTGEHIVRTLFHMGPFLARKLMGITEGDFKSFNQSNKDGNDETK